MMQTLTSIVFLGFTIIQSSFNNINENNYFWQESDEWSPCSVLCGEGKQTKELFCAIKVNLTLVKSPKKKCSHLKQPNILVRFCYKDDCPEKYSWNTSPWSQCSHSCGNLGFRFRDIECNQNITKAKTISVDENLCAKFVKPIQRSMCNRINCLPEFETGKWENCVKAPGCQPGNQKRKLKCTQILKSGEIKALPLFRCYRKGKAPPPQWKKCYDFVNIPECLKGIPPRKVEFNVVNNNVYQMRRSKIVNLQIGQIGYLLPYARLLISCPVEHFPQHNIIWKHKNVTLKYTGRVSQRIRVDKLGQLRIRKLFFQDQGEWICVADRSQKSVIIKIRNPSSGFRDWAVRNNLWKTGMLSEDSKKSNNRQELIQWITSEWSICSVTCSGDGLQYREVHCEKVEPRFYIVLDDNDCEKILSPPSKMRSCYTAVECPIWKIASINKSKCTNECIDIGLSSLEVELKCIYMNQYVPLHLCEPRKKPAITCQNKACQLDWRLNSWSKCSKSCDGTGFQARSIVCVWKSTRKSAGSLCYENKFPVPKVIRKCETKPCVVECVDLSPKCLNEPKRCQYNLYKYLCCLTCQNYFQKIYETENLTK